MKRIINILASAAVIAATFSCVKDLDQYPQTDMTSKDVYKDADGYQGVLSGIYAAFIQRIGNVSTESRSQNWIRTMMMFQDASTDALDAIWLAGESLTDVNGLSWTAGDPWVSAAYYHIYNIVAMTNELIRNCDESLISGFSEEDKARIRICRDEARFLRAYAYMHALDFYPKMSFITENDPVGSFIPQIYDRKQMFGYLENELKAVAGTLKNTSYGHATSYAAWALLSRLYINGEAWTGRSYATECIDACRKVLDGGFSLEEDYAKLFNGDNHLRTNEIIFAFACDGARTTTWDATTFITCGSVLSDFDDYDKVHGTTDSGPWDCLRARPDLVNTFTAGDSRARFLSYDRLLDSLHTPRPAGYYTKDGDILYIYKERSKDIIGHDETTSGWRITKWTNLTDAGEPASRCSDGGGANTDFPVLRLAEIHLNLAEAVLRGGTGASVEDALSSINSLRARAFGSEGEAITAEELTLDFILDERLREMYMECIRRTDLIRFGKYTSGKTWQWKGGTLEGKDTDDRFAFLPVPEAELSVNPDMKTVNAQLGY